MSFLKFLAKRFIAGETKEKTIKKVKKLHSKNIKAILDILGENVYSKREALNYVNQYIKLLDLIKKSKVDAKISIKLTEMGLDINEKFCINNIGKILRKAKQTKNFVMFDMESSKYTDKTIEVFKILYKNHKNLGLCIQSYLKRSEKDIKNLIKLKPRIRLVKGAYKEPYSISYRYKKDTDKNYEKILKLLMSKKIPVDIATHDDKLIELAKKLIRKYKLNKRDYEFQMLLGVRPRLQQELANEGYLVRTYVPYGTHWLPYTLRRLRERKENLFFVIRHLFKK